MHASQRDRMSDVAALRFDDGGVYVGEEFQTLVGRILRHDFELRPTTPSYRTYADGTKLGDYGWLLAP